MHIVMLKNPAQKHTMHVETEPVSPVQNSRTIPLDHASLAIQCSIKAISLVDTQKELTGYESIQKACMHR